MVIVGCVNYEEIFERGFCQLSGSCVIVTKLLEGGILSHVINDHLKDLRKYLILQLELWL